MAQWLRALAALPEHLVQFPAPTEQLTLPVTLVSDLTPSQRHECRQNTSAYKKKKQNSTSLVIRANFVSVAVLLVFQLLVYNSAETFTPYY